MATPGNDMGDDIIVDKCGISISWKLFVGAVVAMLGFYVASQVAPLQTAVSSLQKEVVNLNAKVDNLEHQWLHITPGINP